MRLPALFAALDALTAEGPLHLCLLLDSCRDGSAALAQAFAAERRHVHLAEVRYADANAGRARDAAMRLGLARDPDLLLSTDADSVPARDWVTAMTAALERADIVAGRITRAVTRPSPLQDRVEAYYDALFAWRRQLDPVPWEAPRTHHYTGGANLGFPAGAYRALGGFRPVATGEDARLIDDAGRAGLRVRRDADCRVVTSDRRHGRTAGGLAAALRELDAEDAGAIRVAHPDDAGWQYRAHARARRAFANDALDAFAARYALDAAHVGTVAAACPNGEAFAMRIVPDPPGGMRHVPFPIAEAALAAEVAEFAA